MELHRNDRGGRKLSLVGIVYGLASALAGGLFALLSGHPNGLSVILWVSGGFFFLVGLYVYLGTLGHFRIALHESGMVVHTGGCDFEGSWDQVDAITVEPVVLAHQTLNQLVLWLPEGTPVRGRPRFPGAGRNGYRLVELGELTQPPEEVIAALRRYAGPKFRSPAPA